MFDPLPEFKRRALTKRREQLIIEYEAINDQIIKELDAAKRKRLEPQLEEFEAQIAEIDMQLNVGSSSQQATTRTANDKDDTVTQSPNAYASSNGSALFQMNYQLVYPYVLASEDALAQALVSFSSSQDSIEPTNKIQTHLCLMLDVSGSMNTPEKYPLLRQAIPFLFQALSDEDYLTIILFSHTYDLILCDQTVGETRNHIDEILSRIDTSGVMFGSQTLLAPALAAAIDEIAYFRKEHPLAVNRLYILTDGELHDIEECVNHNVHLRSLEAEIHSYGFGRDFALESMREIMDGVPGGTVKPIFNTQDVMRTFSHIGELMQRIIAQDARFVFVFAPDVIAGDAFRYQPGTKYWGAVDRRHKTFEIKMGALEQNRTYTFAFEGRLLKSDQTHRQCLGTAILEYRVGRNSYKEESSVYVNRTSNSRRASQSTESVLEIFTILEALRDNSPEAQLRALKARHVIYQREGGDPVLIQLLVQAIDKLQRGEPLDPAQARDLKADHGTQTGSPVEDAVLTAATIWLQQGYDPVWIRWAADMASILKRQNLYEVKSALNSIQNKVLDLLLDYQYNLHQGLSDAELKAFDKSIRG